MATLIRRQAFPVAIVVASLFGTTVVVAGLEAIGVRDASAAYLLAVVAAGVLAGTGPAIATAVGGFALYDFLFITPHYTLTVADAQEWLNLLLLLVVGIVVGRLSGRERARAETALAREREARALFRVSFALASATSTATALPEVVGVLRTETGSDRVWIDVADHATIDSATLADAPGMAERPGFAVHSVLRRQPGDEPATWARIHAPMTAPAVGRRRASGSIDSDMTTAAMAAYRVTIAAGDRELGSLWILRPRKDGDPDLGETRVLAATADQIAGALDRDRLAAVASAAEVARRSDVLKSALLDSVSHDLRTPLASIRAAAGTLMDPDIDWSDEERRAIAASIDREADRLNRLVADLLDMSRIEAGELRPRTSAFVLDDIVRSAVDRVVPTDRRGSVALAVPEDLPPVEVDEVFIGQVLDNVLENAVRYAGEGAPIRVRTAARDGTVDLTIEDGGPGVPDDALPSLFEKFYRVPRAGEGSRRGTGIGLAVARGLVVAMGGTMTARRSDLGGLAIDLVLPTAPTPAIGVIAEERR